MSGLKAKAAAWGAGSTLYVLVENEGKRETLVVRGGQVVETQPAAPKASLIVVLPSGAVLTMAREGKGKLVPPGGPQARATNLSLGLDELVVCHGAAFAGGRRRQLSRFDEAKANWSSTGLRAAVAPLIPEVPGSADGVAAVVEGKAGPIVAVRANRDDRVLVMEFDGTAWTLRCDLPEPVHALAWRADQDLVYALGKRVCAIDAQGQVTRPATGSGREFWSAGWARGALFAGSLRGVYELEVTTGPGTVRFPEGEGEVPQPHSLVTSGDDVAFVCGGQVHVFDGSGFVTIALG